MESNLTVLLEKELKCSLASGLQQNRKVWLGDFDRQYCFNIKYIMPFQMVFLPQQDKFSIMLEFFFSSASK